MEASDVVDPRSVPSGDLAASNGTHHHTPTVSAHPHADATGRLYGASTTHCASRVSALLCCAVLRPHHPQAGPSRSPTAVSSLHRKQEQAHTQTTCAPCLRVAFRMSPATFLPPKPSHHAKKVRHPHPPYAPPRSM